MRIYIAPPYLGPEFPHDQRASRRRRRYFQQPQQFCEHPAPKRPRLQTFRPEISEILFD